MPRRDAEERTILDTLRHLMAAERDGLPAPEREALLHALLASSSLRARFESLLVRHLMDAGDEQGSLRRALDEMSGLVEQLTQPPWIPAVYLGTVETPAGPHALVALGRERRVVGFGERVAPPDLLAGDEVYLASDRQAVMDRAAGGARPTGEVAEVVGRTDAGLLVIRSRDEEVVVWPGGRLDGASLAEGDRVLWNPEVGLALEIVPHLPSHRFLLEDVPDLPLDAIGGLDDEIARVVETIALAIEAPALARRYRLDGRVSVMLVGPSGVGKTLLTRVVAAEIQRLAGRPCRIAVVPPAAWESAYVGQTEANIRALFETLRTEAADGLAILLLDEIDAVGRARGNHNGFHGDRFLTALLHEIDGFETRGNVVIIAASNRKDLLDPALIERLCGVEVRIPRPDRTAARRILEIHLAEVPCADDREALMERILTRFYARNGSALTLLRLRDGTERVVHARDLMSGRVLEQVCRDARRLAAGRELRGDDPGLRMRDVERAAADALVQLSTVLGPRNAILQLPDLPMDVDVVAAEPLIGRVTRPADYRPAA